MIAPSMDLLLREIDAIEAQLAEAARRDTLSQSVAESREMSQEIAAPRQENVENPAENGTGEIDRPRDSSNCVAECRKLSHETAHSREETSEIPAKNAEIAVVRHCDTACDTACDTECDIECDTECDAPAGTSCDITCDTGRSSSAPDS